MRRHELSGSVQSRDRLIEDRRVALEDVGHAWGDVERHLDVGARGFAREANGIIEQHLVAPGLDDQGRQAGQAGELGTDQRPPRSKAS